MRRKELGKKHKPRDASHLKVGIAVARFHEDITGNLLEGAIETLRAWKVKDADVRIAHVYGSFELPFACQSLVMKHKVNALVALGCIVKGETMHDEYLAQAVFGGLQRVALDASVPVGLGVLTVNNLKQARVRARGTHNHGAQAAAAALEAALAP